MKTFEYASTIFPWANVLLAYFLMFAYYLPELQHDGRKNFKFLPEKQIKRRKEPHSVPRLENPAPSLPVTFPYNVLCIESAYKNLLSIIEDQKNFFVDFVAILKTVKILCKDKEVRSLFRVVEREQGPLLMHSLQRKRIELTAFLLKEFDPREKYEGWPIWMSALGSTQLINLLLDDGRVLHYELVLTALTEKSFDDVLTVVSHPGFDSTKFPFLLHELLRYQVPRPLIKEVYLKGRFSTAIFSHFNLYLIHLSAVKEKFQRSRPRMEPTLFTNIFELAKPLFTKPEEAAIFGHLRKNFLHSEIVVYDFEVMIEAFQTDIKENCIPFLLKVVNASKAYLSKAEANELANLPLPHRAKYISHLLMEKTLILTENVIRTLRSK